MKEQFVLTIKAEDRPGLLHLITGVVEKRLVKIISLSYAPTDIHGIILITVEVSGDESILAQLAFKLENIVEVFIVEVSRYNSALCLRAAYFKMNKTFLESPGASVMSKYDTTILKFYADTFLLAKYGTDAAILNLYNELDGPHLVGFSQTGLISDSALIGEDQSSVINRLAA
ncbi:MAG: ilvH 1 [Mucilaginibacter sp.]|nr:ilvH 1 [Mucilaginibacter sp.]